MTDDQSRVIPARREGPFESAEEVRLSLYRELRGERSGRRDDAVMVPCFFCPTSFQTSHGVYRGKHIPRYQIDVCQGCYDGNWDGWAPRYEAQLVHHLEANGLRIPERNEKGWLPRD